MKKTETNLLLFSITLCWAASYIFIKNLPSDFSDYAYLTLTTGIAAVLMAGVFCKKLRQIKKSTVLKGFLLSLLLSLNLLAERKGIVWMEPEMASFLSALTIIMVPLLLLFMKRRPSANNLVGAGIILLGLCAGVEFRFAGLRGEGVFYLLAACACSAVYTVAVDRYAKEEEPLLLCIVQMFFSALTGFVLWFCENPLTFQSVDYTRELLSNIIILAFFTKAYAYIVLMFSQKYTDAVSVTVIGSMEPIVTLVLAVLLPATYGGNHKLTKAGVIGAGIIAVGAVVAGLHFLERKSEKKSEKKRDWYKVKQFFVVLISFLVLGISFKVMVLVEGLTEVRPVNAIPPVAGLLCGPAGAFACGIGNLLSDIVGTFSAASILGFAGNFVAAYLPYRIWYLFSDEPPNVHTGRNRMRYIILSLTAAMTVAWILSFGLYWMEGVWMESIYRYVFWNNLGFSVGLGMPILIILTSQEVPVRIAKPPKGLWTKSSVKFRKAVFGIYMLCMGILLLCIQFLKIGPEQNFWMLPLSAILLVTLIGLLT